MSCSAFCTIVRNLYIVKGRPPSPARVWRKKTGPRDVSRITKAMSKSKGEWTSKNSTEPKTSIARFHRGRP